MTLVGCLSPFQYDSQAVLRRGGNHGSKAASLGEMLAWIALPALAPSQGVSRVVPAPRRVGVPTLSGSESTASSFLFTTCQAGAEKLLKVELERTHPEMRFAFSRPGLVTFKNASTDGVVSPSVSIGASFARTYGASVGQARACHMDACTLMWLIRIRTRR